MNMLAKLAFFHKKRITVQALNRDFCRFRYIFADFATLGLHQPFILCPHPDCYRLAHLALEGIAEGAITTITTL